MELSGVDNSPDFYTVTLHLQTGELFVVLQESLENIEMLSKALENRTLGKYKHVNSENVVTIIPFQAIVYFNYEVSDEGQEERITEEERAAKVDAALEAEIQEIIKKLDAV